MANIVIARSCYIQAVFALFAWPVDVLNKLKKLKEFLNHQLTPAENRNTEKPGWITQGDRTLVRWKVGKMNVIILCDRRKLRVMVDVTEKLDTWTEDDARYGPHLKKMITIIAGFAKHTGLQQRTISSNDPDIKLRRDALERIYGPQSWYGGDGDTEYLAVVALQGLGADPFVRLHQNEVLTPGRGRSSRKDDFEAFLDLLPDAGQ